jgi:hypothetical protein
MIAGVEFVMKNAAAGDGIIDRVLKVKVWPRHQYVEMAAKHFKLLTDVIQVVDVDKLNAVLEAGRMRHAKVLERIQPTPTEPKRLPQMPPKARTAGGTANQSRTRSTRTFGSSTTRAGTSGRFIP